MIYIADLIAIFFISITGALAAGRKRLDLFGVVVFGCVTAIGGGTLRDIVLGSHPIFWISDPIYLWVAAVAAMLTFVVARKLPFPNQILRHIDAIALALFTVIGYQKGLDAVGHKTIAVVTGVMTGVAGGTIRDVLSGETPVIFKQEIYATASLAGAVALALCPSTLAMHPISQLTAGAIVLTIRLLGMHCNLRLPQLTLSDQAVQTTPGIEP